MGLSKPRVKDGERHIYAQRNFFIDEDTWTASVVLTTTTAVVNYGVLLKPITHNSTVATYRGWQQKHSMTSTMGRYIALGLANEEGDFIDFNITPRRQDFTQQALRRMGIRLSSPSKRN